MTTPRPTVPIAAFEAAEQAAYECPCHTDGPGLSNCCLGAGVNAAAPHIEAQALRNAARTISVVLYDIDEATRASRLLQKLAAERTEPIGPGDYKGIPQ